MDGILQTEAPHTKKLNLLILRKQLKRIFSISLFLFTAVGTSRKLECSGC